MSSGLSTLFSEESKKKYERAVRPREFDAKKKPELDEKGRVKISKKQKRLDVENSGEGVKKKKPKHKHRGRSSTSSLSSAASDTGGDKGVNDEKDEKTIFVGNIPLSADMKRLKKYFKEFGEIETIRLRSVPIAGVAVDDHGNQDLVKKVCTNTRKFGDQKGSFNAYIVFNDPACATAALTANNRMMDDRHLRVDRSNPTLFDPQLTVFLGNLPHYTDEEELRTHFAKILPNGQDDIENLRLIRDPETLIGKNIGYLLLRNHDALIQVLQSTEQKFKKRVIRIKTCGKRTKNTEKRKAGFEDKGKIESTDKKVKNLEFDGNEEIGDEISANGDLRMKNQKVRVEAINALAASRRIVAKMQKAKESIGKKKKGLSSSYNSGKKKTTKQLGGQLKRAMKVQAGKKLS